MSLSRANRSWLKNIWVPLALQVVTIGDIVGTDEPWWGLLLAQVVILPLFVRHRYPMAVLVWVTFAAFATSLLVVLPGSMFAVMVAVYTVATQRDRRSALTGAAVTQVTVIAASIVFNPAADSVIASLVFLTGLNLAALFLGTTVRANRLYLTSLVERNRQLELERDQQAQLAVAAERTRIAREMHDVVAHSLSVMVTLSDGAVAVGKRDAQAATAAMEQVAATGRQALAEMRRLLNVLRDDQLAERSPQPDLSRLEPMLDDVRATGLEVILRISGVPLALAQTAESTIYRIIQESLTNVIKHAIAPTRVVVSLAWEDDGVTLEVVDDGAVVPDSGFDPGDGGYGLRGIRERVALYDGSVQSGPVPPHGWRVRATLSFRQEAP